MARGVGGVNYYNEWDKPTAAWLRELVRRGLIPNGVVDDRSITDVSPSDLRGYGNAINVEAARTFIEVAMEIMA